MDSIKWKHKVGLVVGLNSEDMDNIKWKHKVGLVVDIVLFY
jgi:hypothetical protein